MCGLAAIYAYHAAALPVDSAELDRISAHMAARGPDGEGSWRDESGRCGLAHRRLAIIDPDPRAAQPMRSGCGRYVISFNGEIYNYQVLREELLQRGCALRTNSDTEVLLELFARDGAACLERLRGMFAFALWDSGDRVMWLARDPYGIKPLYYADDGWTVRAASQVKSLLAGGAVSSAPEPAGIVGFFLFGSVPEPFTCWQEIRAVPAGSIVRVDALGAHVPESYLSIGATIRQAEAAPADAALLPQAFLDSVRHHLVADVPVGMFLSAGVDSGALLALFAQVRGGSAEGVQAITVTYPEYRGTADDEAPLAAEVAAAYGARHEVRVVDEAEFRADLPQILAAMDQPTIDGVNSWFVSKSAHAAGLKVALSGLGGDELLGGYGSFRDIPHWLRTVGWSAKLPLVGRLARTALTSFGGGRLHPKAAGMLELGGSWAGAYLLRRGLFMPWELDSLLPPEIVRDGLRRLGWEKRLAGVLQDGPQTAFGRVATLESSLYMRNQLLRDTDWASMAHSLEVRVPLVDVPLLSQVAPAMIARPERGKQALADVLSPPLPGTVTRRAKTGFTTPVQRWLDRAAEGSDVLGAQGEPWARRWARFVAARELPAGVFPAEASSARSQVTGMAA